jgi:hypothetical protein
MLTGRRAFGRENTSRVLAAVLANEPDWTSLPGKTQHPSDNSYGDVWRRIGGVESRTLLMCSSRSMKPRHPTEGLGQDFTAHVEQRDTDRLRE